MLRLPMKVESGSLFTVAKILSPAPAPLASPRPALTVMG